MKIIFNQKIDVDQLKNIADTALYFQSAAVYPTDIQWTCRDVSTVSAQQSLVAPADPNGPDSRQSIPGVVRWTMP
jgi:hypothetical protein